MELFTHITLPGILVIAQGIMSLVIGMLVYTREITHKGNIFFFLFAFSIFVWSFSLGVFESVSSELFEYIYLMIFLLSLALTPLMLLYFFIYLPAGEFRLTKVQLFSFTIPFLGIVAALAIPSFIVESVDVSSGWAKDITWGSGVLYYLAVVLLYILGSFVVLMKKYTESAGIFKTQLFYIALLFIVFVPHQP